MPVNSNAEINSYLEGIQKTNPPLYNLLRLLSEDLNFVVDTLIPQSVQSVLSQINQPAKLAVAVDTFTYTLTPLTVRFNWTTDDPASVQFEIRRGSVWDTADFQLRTSAFQADINPIPTGTTHFLIRSINIDGVISTEELGVDVVVTGIAGPIVSPQVIDNNVLLSWSIPNSPFQIAYYNIYRDGIKIGTQTGTFFVYFEVFSGQFTYSVEAVDIAGNIGALGSVIVDVGQPPDFVLEDSRVSDLLGTRVNTVRFLDDGTPKLLCCIDTTETWQQHFLSRGWNNIQDQVAAGYNIYGEPYALTGSYQEVIDYGAEFSSLVVNLDWSINTLLGSVNATATIESSLDGVVWENATLGRSAFFTSLRYARITINFASLNDKSIIEFYNLRIFLNVKLVLTSGNIVCNADANDPETYSSGTIGGTYVPFEKPYKDVNSITLTSNSKSPITPIYKFVDKPNPDGFKILVFDSSGNRISQEVSWKVRGTL